MSCVINDERGKTQKGVCRIRREFLIKVVMGYNLPYENNVSKIIGDFHNADND